MKILNIFLILLLMCGAKSLNTTDHSDNKSGRGYERQQFNASIRKCHCKAGHIWVNSYCIEAETFVPTLSFNPWTEKIYNTRSLSVERISEVRCETNQLLVPLKAGSFFIVENGDLFHLYTGLLYQTKDYCIEHIIGRRGNVRLDAMVCINRPIVPRCCPNKHVLELKSFTCKYNINSVYKPTIIKEPAILKWHSVDGPFVGFPVCHESEVYKRVNLENRRVADLLYRSNGIFLHWKASSETLPYIIGPDDYCVAIEEKKGKFLHSAFYCDEPLSVETMTAMLYRKLNKTIPESYLISFIVYPVVIN